ncbi:MAG TPA: glycoside hydrolase family 6 protein [Candidatus Limnocylindrales bacterium]|nr:glycoside hydrolase family 6 protein [Candidatus Limnocylindrales bacterium]
MIRIHRSRSQEQRHRLARVIAAASVAGALVAALGGPAVAADPPSESSLDPQTRFSVPKPNHGAIVQIADLRSTGRFEDASLVETMIETPQADWFTRGSPAAVERAVRSTVSRAAGKGTVPVLVAYNIPFRDCAQFSAGGATTPAEYLAWIDGFARGIGDRAAIVILEPDGLGIIPWYRQFRGTAAESPAYEWCQPAEAEEATAADDRFAMLSSAVDTLKARPNVHVYLDGTHSAWLGSGDAAHRLIQAGVERADGFFVNVSNYRLTEHLVKYGGWVSDCLHLAQNSWWQVEWCASQYFPANPNDFSTWGLTDAAYDQAFADTGLTRDPAVQAHFVVDTSRNGRGPWTPPAYPDPQDWCNPPDRGLGLRPTADTGNALIDAYLWIKIPGESDGECTRGLGPAGSTVDPEWGRVDPAAGAWFPEMAIELARNAEPGL